MSRWWLVLVLTVAAAPVWAQPAQPAAVTAKAQAEARSLEKQVTQAASTRSALAKKYEDELKTIDRLKQQRASWRRDRELRDNLAEANETAGQLATATTVLSRAQTALTAARRTLATAIDAELKTGVAAPRATELHALQAQLAPQARTSVHRIVLPDTRIDPLADPEELDQQAAALRDSEAELSREVIGLEKQAQDLDEVARLRAAHDRANALSRRDDDQPHRTATASSGSRGGAFDESSSPSPQSAGGGGTTGGSPPPGGSGGATAVPSNPAAGSYESEATVVLADVIDATTIEALSRAQRSGDPTQRAAAAKRTRDAVAARLEQLRKKRAEVEAAAKARRLQR